MHTSRQSQAAGGAESKLGEEAALQKPGCREFREGEKVTRFDRGSDTGTSECIWVVRFGNFGQSSFNSCCS